MRMFTEKLLHLPPFFLGSWLLTERPLCETLAASLPASKRRNADSPASLFVEISECKKVCCPFMSLSLSAKHQLFAYSYSRYSFPLFGSLLIMITALVL
jgi:hypothetical protein